MKWEGFILNASVCCFSGYRPEKMPSDMTEGSPAFMDMLHQLKLAVCDAADHGYRHFLSGMSRGFDIWAAEIVLDLARQGMNIDLWAAIAFPGMHQDWHADWRTRYDDVLAQARRIFPLYDRYTVDCYTARDRFLVEQSSLCICYFDGIEGGTQYTVNYARRKGLIIQNLADPQISFV